VLTDGADSKKGGGVRGTAAPSTNKGQLAAALGDVDPDLVGDPDLIGDPDPDLIGDDEEGGDPENPITSSDTSPTDRERLRESGTPAASRFPIENVAGTQSIRILSLGDRCGEIRPENPPDWGRGPFAEYQ